MKRTDSIVKPSEKVYLEALTKWNSIAKPLGSLGLLEESIMKIAAIKGSADFMLSKRTAVIMCADNGVVCEKVTQSDSSVTAVVADSIASGTSNINSMANVFSADVIAVDIGMNSDAIDKRVLDKKISYGTNNIAVEAAMSISQAEKAICVGMDTVKLLRDTDIIITGEMGIGNTTTSSALASVLLDMPPESVTGRGAGLDSDGLARKKEVIRRAIEINKPDKSKPVELLAKLGGYDIAGMTGLFLGGAVYHVPVVIDGLISAVAAVIAAQINPLAKDYMLPSHVSKEPAGKMLLDMLGMKPLIAAELRLGEGTGGILLLPLLDGAMAVYNNNAHRFDELSMERYEKLI